MLKFLVSKSRNQDKTRKSSRFTKWHLEAEFINETAGATSVKGDAFSDFPESQEETFVVLEG